MNSSKFQFLISNLKLAEQNLLENLYFRAEEIANNICVYEPFSPAHTENEVRRVLSEESNFISVKSGNLDHLIRAAIKAQPYDGPVRTILSKKSK